MSTRPATAARRLTTDPLVPLVVLGTIGLASAFVPVATWAALGGLAGYTLSGSV